MRDASHRSLRAGAGNIYMAGAALALASSALAVQTGSVTTTIYVGRHFEVRDHDQPTKYVFNGSTRVAEITGSLSANTRVQRLRLCPGWNLCSLAVSGPFPASGAEAISAAYQWNPSSSNYLQITLGQSLAAGTVLWLKARTNAVVSVLGAYADPVPRQVQAGGRYVPAAGLEAWSPALPDSASSWDFEASTAEWFGHLKGDLASVSGPPPTLSPGQALYLEATAPASLEIPDQTLRIRYYHEDHLGSSTAVTDANGSLVQETAFYPFGSPRHEYRTRQVEAKYQFTQKEQDRETGLHYFETRYLASALGRFVTPDLKYACPDRFSVAELSAYASVPQQFNLYAYVRNNPLKYIDPLGQDASKRKHEPEPPDSDTQLAVTLTLETGEGKITLPITSFSFGVDRPVVSGSENAGTAKGQQAAHDLVISRSTDKWSQTLMRRASGSDPASVALRGEITVRKTVAGHSEVYVTYKLMTVFISGYSLGGSGGGLPTEQIHLHAKEIKLDFPVEQKTGQVQGAGEPAVLRNRYYKPELSSNRWGSMSSLFEDVFSTAAPLECRAAESHGDSGTYPPP